jgi:glucose-1-phosphate cytidylyltransferase
MDTLRDKNILNKLWQEGKAPWKIWQLLQAAHLG